MRNLREDLGVRDMAGGYQPNPNKLIQLFAAGLVATIAMLALAYALPVFGLPEHDFAGVYGAVFNNGVLPNKFSGLWWVGLMWHFINGIVVFSLLYDYFADRRVLTNARWVKGLLWGSVLWIVVESIIKPLAGQGFFSRFMEAPALTAWLGLLCWLMYGAVLEGMTRVRIAHAVTGTQKEAA